MSGRMSQGAGGIGVLLTLTLMLTGAERAEAQVRLPDPSWPPDRIEAPEPTRPDTGMSGVSRWSASGGMFAGIVPTPPAGSCAAAMLPSTGLDASVILRLRGPWSLESHGRVMIPIDYTSCVTTGEARPDGVYRSHDADYGENGTFGALDMRMRYQPPEWDGIVLAAGPGLVTADDVPFFVAAVGKRFGGDLGLAIDAEVMTFWVPFAIREESWQAGSLQTSRIVERGHEFRPGIALRIALEKPLGGILR